MRCFLNIGNTHTQILSVMPDGGRTVRTVPTADFDPSSLPDGTEVFEKHSVRWRRGRANPCGGYDIIKTEKWTALYVNGTYVRGATVAQVEATN